MKLLSFLALITAIDIIIFLNINYISDNKISAFMVSLVLSAMINFSLSYFLKF